MASEEPKSIVPKPPSGEENNEEKAMEESTVDGVEEAAGESEATIEEEQPEGTSGEEEKDENRKLTVDDLKTAPMDFRFPTTNQARHCFTRYIEYHKCSGSKGEDAPECERYKRWYQSLCPDEWIERWDEQRENGTFAGPL